MDETYEEHKHEIHSAISEEQAKTRLDALTLTQLHEIVKADGLPEILNRGAQIKTILLAWFSPDGVAGRRIPLRELLDQAENLPRKEMEFEEHKHEVHSPISEKQAKIRLDAFTLTQLHEIAKADGLPENPNRGVQIKTILLAWFSPVDGIAGRVISFQEILDEAENLPQGKRRAWRKRTHGKEMGF